MDRGAWQAIYSPRDLKESDTTKRLTLSHFDSEAMGSIYE